VEAFKWWIKAAELGDLLGQQKAGLAFFYGQGVPVNKAEGLKWLRLAADRGDPSSSFVLAQAYQTGDGGQKDLRQAIKYYRQSIKRHLWEELEEDF
ncbi:MAG: sel1 repeat family protein, partial [Deltaproteobacteria bacterium]|nr:sel1 repeat family protein [Deltaproteobacteria bacterium]